MILTEHSKHKPKNAITISHVPTYIDKSNPPLKREPFKTILQHATCHTLDLVLPQEQDKQSLAQVIETHGKLHWCKVYMKLIDIISRDFFDIYIKTGDILMLSEGRAGLDNCFSLQGGILRLAIDKATFESLGLEGKAIPDHGRKHVKSRYAVEMNLREPSMVRGKKGFQRVIWAFENVLNQSVTWLFVNLRERSSFEGPIASHSPIIRSITPDIEVLDAIQTPSMKIDTFDEEDLLELQEWSSLAMLDSPRIRSNDKIDSYLICHSIACCYAEIQYLADTDWTRF
ncbi:hypothetical protein MRB53_042302 [Persea americana]|nr:hypothetical protein MRB53_042302 [Persea americana]